MSQLRIKSKRQFRDIYESEAKAYDIKRSTSFEGKIVDSLQIKLVLDILKKMNKKYRLKVLEAGCGTGRILIPVSKRGYDCYGFDPSNNMLSVISKKAKEENTKLSLRKGDIEKIPFSSNTFDVVYTMHVLMHLPEHQKAIKEMYRVLKPGGIMIADFPNKNSIWTTLSLLFEPKRKRTNLFTRMELRRLFKGYNYKITGLFSYARTFYRIPVIRNIVKFLDAYVPLPIGFRTQLIVIVKK